MMMLMMIVMMTVTVMVMVMMMMVMMIVIMIVTMMMCHHLNFSLLLNVLCPDFSPGQEESLSSVSNVHGQLELQTCWAVSPPTRVLGSSGVRPRALRREERALPAFEHHEENNEQENEDKRSIMRMSTSLSPTRKMCWEKELL